MIYQHAAEERDRELAERIGEGFEAAVANPRRELRALRAV
jgi:hypothetical protein